MWNSPSPSNSSVFQAIMQNDIVQRTLNNPKTFFSEEMFISSFIVTWETKRFSDVDNLGESQFDHELLEWPRHRQYASSNQSHLSCWTRDQMWTASAATATDQQRRSLSSGDLDNGSDWSLLFFCIILLDKFVSSSCARTVRVMSHRSFQQRVLRFYSHISFSFCRPPIDWSSWRSWVARRSCSNSLERFVSKRNRSWSITFDSKEHSYLLFSQPV